MAWKRSTVRTRPGPPKQSPIKHSLTNMLARFHVAGEVKRSPFGVQTGRDLDSSLAALDVETCVRRIKLDISTKQFGGRDRPVAYATLGL